MMKTLPDDALVGIADLDERRKAVLDLKSWVECGLADRDERDIGYAMGALAEAMFDTDAQVRRDSLEAIDSALHDRQDIDAAYPAMLRVLADPRHDLRRAAARFCLYAARQEVSQSERVAALRPLLSDVDPEVKRDVVQALSVHYVLTRSWDALGALLGHEDGAIREQALRAHITRQYMAYRGGEMAPVLPTLVALLADPVEAVRHAAALAVVTEDREAGHFEVVTGVLVDSLGADSAGVRVEAAEALARAAGVYLEVNAARSRDRENDALAPLIAALEARSADDGDIVVPCTQAQTRLLVASGRWDAVARLLESGEPNRRAAAIAELGRRTERFGSNNACRGLFGVAWKTLDPIVPALERQRVQRCETVRAAATRALARIAVHRRHWEAAIELFGEAKSPTPITLLSDLDTCLRKRCGRIDALLPTLFEWATRADERLASEALRHIEMYTAPGAYGPPWRGDLSFEEQARRARVVLVAIESSGFPMDERGWRLRQHTTAILHAKLVASVARRVDKRRGDAKLGALIDASSHENGQVRAWAVHELTSIVLGGSSIGVAFPALERCLNDGDMFVRAEAAEALGQAALRGEADLAAVLDLTRRLDSDEIGPVRFAMARALGMLAQKGVELDSTLPALVKGLKDSDPRVRWCCSTQLYGLCGSKEGAARTLDALRCIAPVQDEEVRRLRERCESRLR